MAESDAAITTPAAPVPLAGAAPGRLRPLRVALFTGSYTFIQDGVALTLNRLTAFLLSRGVEVLIFTPLSRRPAFAYVGEVVNTPSMPMPLRPEYRLALRLSAKGRRRLEAFAPDLIHVATPDFPGHAARRAGLRMGAPVVGSYHTRYETYLKHYGFQWLEGPITRMIANFYAGCREVYVPSRSMAEVIAAKGAGDNIHLWTRGVDTDLFNPAKRDEAWRRAQGFEPSDVVITFVGRLVREKRLSTFVDALQGLARAGVAHRVLIVGDGPELGALRKALPGAVFTGFLTGEALARAYASAEIFVFPSDSETFGNVTLEAMASGLPTLCADATGSRSLVDPGVTGFLADPADGPAFQRHIAELIADPKRRAAMGAAARARSLTFSWEETMAGLLARYEALVGAGR